MLNNKFKSQSEFDTYIAEQNIRMTKGFLTRSEREQLKTMLVKDYKPIIIEQEKTKLPLVTNLEELKKPCQEVTKDDNILEIIQKLKDTATCYSGYGISANQIGIQKRISYVKIPKIVNKELQFSEYILINAKIVEKERPIKLQNEMCLSFPGIPVTTERYVFCTVEYLNEKMELQTGLFSDLESFAIQHEIDHQFGITLFDKKWRAR